MMRAKAVITRPKHQSEQLTDLLTKQNIRVINFPTIEIIPKLVRPDILDALEQYDIAIFTSTNAVTCIQPHWPTTPKHLTIATIGPATTVACERAGFTVTLTPADRFNSEALLALPEFTNIADKNVLIVTGENGRTYLADTLQARNARVTLLTCYCRQQPSLVNTSTDWINTSIDIIICTSNTSLEHLTKMLPAAHQAWLKSQQLLVVSERAVSRAKQLGFTKIPILSASALDADIARAIQTWQQQKDRG